MASPMPRLAPVTIATRPCRIITDLQSTSDLLNYIEGHRSPLVATPTAARMQSEASGYEDRLPSVVLVGRPSSDLARLREVLAPQLLGAGLVALLDQLDQLEPGALGLAGEAASSSWTTFR